MVTDFVAISLMLRSHAAILSISFKTTIRIVRREKKNTSNKTLEKCERIRFENDRKYNFNKDK
jgi:hypothetical protein